MRPALSVLLLLLAGPASANLGVDGEFRAVGIAHATFPITALAVAPDGRLFAAVQELGQTSGSTPGTAEIRVYSAYRTTDGSVLDEGATWATLDDIRATSIDEGLLGIALAPDFATSKLVYVYVTATSGGVTQELRVFRENAGGTGDFLGVVRTGLEPPTEQSVRSGGGLTFGADGCLYVGIGDNGGTDRWNAQVLVGTNGFGGTETSNLCTTVCTGPAELPDRTVANNDGQPNPAGKALRLAVEGPSTAVSGPSNPWTAEADAFAVGLRNPTAFLSHPLTGQLYATDRSDAQQAEVDILDRGGNQGWPCLEGTGIPTNAACLSGLTADDVYANHPTWRRPIATHTGNPTITGLAAYTGAAYPASYFGDVFYLLRGNARIYRLDLDAPCFLPHPGGIVPTIVHDVTDPSQVGSDNGDFFVVSDFDGDGLQDSANFPSLTAIVQGPDPRGEQVLYVAGKQGGTGLGDDTVIFRIEYPHTGFTPYTGSTGHIPDSCFTDGTYSGAAVASDPYVFENPFLRPTCLPPGGPCPGQPDGTDCSNADVCDGNETCRGGVCEHSSAPAPDGTSCSDGNACLAAGSCASARCTPGGALPDGSPCPDAEPCNGLEHCAAGVCMPGDGPAPLVLRNLQVVPERRGEGSGALTLAGAIHPEVPLEPATNDALAFTLSEETGTVFSGTLPAGDAGWRPGRAGSFTYHGSPLSTVKLRRLGNGDVRVAVRGKQLDLSGPTGSAVATRLVIGDQCFVADSTCTARGRGMRCR